ncbi:MAG TPA: hypothetical protein DDZ80_11325 [Cyanobacteria bacterium UBA8803]|nr:hypothetical protein [Cyanobacteria bacterium UBA9273]HBL59082.1 hypothetical protein [Cyanobacteria bacterium UBA8803]
MTWKAYRVVFKLKSPMHIGCGKIGNVQRTRPYVTGRVFWGALTMRLTRDATSGSATDSEQYEEFGKKVHKQLAYTYFYPAIKPENQDYEIQWLWKNESKNESQFRRRFLSSYASTALVYPQQAADEGLLHEVEFISPRTLDKGEQVYLVGYVFEKEDCDIAWQEACQKLQMGGERGYGWGAVACQDIQEISETRLFNDDSLSWKEENEKIAIQLSTSQDKKGYILAHTVAESNSLTRLQGEIEPLVGREWRSHNSTNRYAGQHVEKFCDPCWVPGSVVERSLDFVIRDFGIWHLPD